jgi:hypothetical protein
VQIPFELWEEIVAQIEPKNEQVKKILAIVEAWKNDSDYPSEEWWDEFEQFLEDNRFTLGEPLTLK